MGALLQLAFHPFYPLYIMKNFFYTLMGALLAAMLFTEIGAENADGLARKTGGAPARLQHKQQQRYKTSQNQPEVQLARKVGGSKTHLLHRQHMQSRRAGQA